MHDVAKPDRITRLDSTSFDGLTKFITGKLLTALKRLDQNLVRSSEGRLIQLGFSIGLSIASSGPIGQASRRRVTAASHTM